MGSSVPACSEPIASIIVVRMRRDSRGAAAMLVAVLWPLVASGDTDRWAPAFSGFGGVITQEWQARGDSEARPAFDGDANVVFPFVGVGAELMTPSPISSWGKPRLFVHGDVAASFDSGWNTAKDNNAGRVNFPIIDVDMDGVPDPVQPPVASARGAGSTARHEAQTARFSAGLGVAFEFLLLDRTLRLRPSVEYQWQETEFRVRVGAAESLGGTTNCPCRILQLDTRESHAFHGIGPAVELELDTGRAGPFILSLYAGIQSYYTIGQREIRVRTAGAFDDGKLSSAETTFERDPWSFNGILGIRFRWMPE